MKSRRIWWIVIFVAAVLGGMADRSYSSNYDIYKYDIENRLGGAHAITFTQDGSMFEVVLKDGPTTIQVSHAADKIFAVKRIWQTQIGNELLMPSLTTAQRDSFTAVDGMGPIHNSTLDEFQARVNGAWVSLAALPIAVADHATGTDGEIPTWDASGNPAVVSAGTANQALTSNGPGAAPTFQSREGARAHRTAVQSISTGVWTAINLDSETNGYDDNTMHDTSTNPSRITIQTAGRYSCYWQVIFAGNATGVRAMAIRLNGTTFISNNDCHGPSTNPLGLNCMVTMNFAANDYIEGLVYQNSGGNLDVNNTAQTSPYLGCQRLRGQ